MEREKDKKILYYSKSLQEKLSAETKDKNNEAV